MVLTTSEAVDEDSGGAVMASVEDVTDSLALVSVVVTGKLVVIVRAGQSVTDGAQEVIVCTVVVKTVLTTSEADDEEPGGAVTASAEDVADSLALVSVVVTG